MLCLDETTPVIMALSLLGAVSLIVGGSLWGNGDSTGIATQTAAGIGLLCVSLLLLGLAALGCWCNRCFCTPERKSKLAKRFYSGGAKKPGGGGDAEAGGQDEDATDSGSLGSSFRSFRSFRRASSRRQSRSAGSLRRDRVKPGASATSAHSPEGATAKEDHQAAAAVETITEQPEPHSGVDQEVPQRQSKSRQAEKQQPALQQTSIDDVSVGEESTEAATPTGTTEGTAAAPASQLPSSESLRDSAPVSC